MFSVGFFPPSLFSLLSRFLLSEWRFFALSALALHSKSQPSGEKTANNSPNTKQQSNDTTLKTEEDTSLWATARKGKRILSLCFSPKQREKWKEL